MKVIFFCAFLTTAAAASQNPPISKPEIVTFQNDSLTLTGELYKPPGAGPFPVILYNHGSAPGMLNSQASAAIGPMYLAHGWAFFMPYRRGQGLSEKAGPYILDAIKSAMNKSGEDAATKEMIRLLKGDHLSDQMAALVWLKKQPWVQKKQIAVAGNSFGGIETILSAAQEPFCAAVDASGGAESWSKAPELQKLLKESVRKSQAPMFFFQAENDFDLSPTNELAAEIKTAGKISETKIYPSYGTSAKDGHSFAYRGAAVWFGDVFAFLTKHCSTSRK